MPFIGLDWRSPGEHWMKTPSGSWERSKILENSRTPSPPADAPVSDRSRENSVSDDADEAAKENRDDSQRLAPEGDDRKEGGILDGDEHRKALAAYQPHCHIAKRVSRENTAYLSLSEAFWKLDFCGAVRDLRRFNYVCKVLDVLISEKLASLGGQAQKLLFSTLEHVVSQGERHREMISYFSLTERHFLLGQLFRTVSVVSTQQNVHIIRQLMRDLNEAMEESKMCWGRHVGSERLWSGHRERLNEWNRVMEDLIVHQNTDNGQTALTDLPEECMRLVLLCLSDHHDLMRCAEALPASPSQFGHLFDEQRLWKELCLFHFDAGQLCKVVKDLQMKNGGKSVSDWEAIYHRMKRLFGLKETYAETLHLCLHCRTLFWQSYGHPCPVLPEDKSGHRWRHFTSKPPIPLSPRAFLEFFSL